MKQIILPFGKLGNEISIIGGRGNGLYINSRRKNHHGLTTADEIIQVISIDHDSWSLHASIDII